MLWMREEWKRKKANRSEVKKFVRDDGVLDEFVVMICRKKDSPLHCMLFRSHVAYLGHETNTESLIAEFCLFSRAGTHMYLYTNAPGWESILERYKKKFQGEYKVEHEEKMMDVDNDW